MTTRLLIARHGETAWNREKIFRGRYDAPLNEAGRAQAERLADALQGLPIDAAYSSPQSRAFETAKLALQGRDMPVAIHEGLADIDFGEWTGLEERAVAERWPALLAQWRRAPHTVQLPAGETLQSVYDRALAAMSDLVAHHADGTVALFAHRVVTKMLLLGALTLGPERFAYLRQDNCCLNELEHTPQGFIVVRLNDTGHLRAAGIPLLQTDF